MPSRGERVRSRLFPGVEILARRGGYTALPFILRTAQFLFKSPRHWQVYTYIMMRTGREGVAWLTTSEMAWDLAYRSVAKLRPYIDFLVGEGWLLRKASRGKDYYLVPDPHQVLIAKLKANKIPAERLEALDELLEALKQPTLTTRAEESDPKAAKPKKS